MRGAVDQRSPSDCECRNNIFSPTTNTSPVAIFMSKILKSIVGLAIISSTIGLAAAPAQAESKTSQCQRFEQAMNQLSQQINRIEYDQNQTSRVNYSRLLGTSKKRLKQFQRNQFSDLKIRSFQQRTVNTWVNVHKNISSAADGVDRDDRVSYEDLYVQLMPAIQLIRTLRQDFGNYCSQPN
jgi:membrane-bound lytic murein transglycosylase